MIRNPKEIIISGYLYNKTVKDKELWCREKTTTHNNFFYNYNNIKNKNKDKEIIKNYKYFIKALNFSNPIPYQTKLNKLNQIDGIIYEMNNVAHNTIMGMYLLEHFNKPNTFFSYQNDVEYHQNR